MPAYISHAIMANDVYDKIDNSNVSFDYMLTYSLGGDLARFSKCRRISHKIKTEEFIDNMWMYMKNNNLVNNPLDEFVTVGPKDGGISGYVRSISQTGDYGQIFARKLPNGMYQIVNGHHRVAALRQLGYRYVNFFLVP